jgi:hypothetical protein
VSWRILFPGNDPRNLLVGKLPALTLGNGREVRRFDDQVRSNRTIPVGFFAMATGAILVKQFRASLHFLRRAVGDAPEMQTYRQEQNPTRHFSHKNFPPSFRQSAGQA